MEKVTLKTRVRAGQRGAGARDQCCAQWVGQVCSPQGQAGTFPHLCRECTAVLGREELPPNSTFWPLVHPLGYLSLHPGKARSHYLSFQPRKASSQAV